MKTKKIKKQLTLNKKTIAGLNDNEKSDVLGGGNTVIDISNLTVGPFCSYTKIAPACALSAEPGFCQPTHYRTCYC